MNTDSFKPAGETLLIDTREPWPHPWQTFLPDVQFQRRGLETGDVALCAAPRVAVERKTISDFLGSISAGRERFNQELRRARYLDGFYIVVEGSLPDCLARRGGMSEASILGTVAAFTRRGFPVLFAGSQRAAALLSWRILSQPLGESNKLVKDSSKPAPEIEDSTPTSAAP